MTTVSNPKIIKGLKILTIISFLAITHSRGTLTLSNILWIIVGTIASFIDLLCMECGHHFEIILKLSLNCIVLSSIYLIFSKKQLLVIGCIMAQFIYLATTFSYEYLKYKYYIIPISIYSILSLILIYYMYFKTQENSL
ncbi:hypothetical protein [Flavobacterium sp.]|jgi:hypothetical protein|uniref:hypothetical protein n=1 Tax=Flavobacterium sp. TaxID=239 RepID=UPI0037C0D93E